MAETPRRFIRVNDDVWSRASLRAHNSGTNPSALINAWLAQYANGNQPTWLTKRKFAKLRTAVTGLGKVVTELDIGVLSDDNEHN